MGTATRFWNWNAERYSRQAIADEASYQKKLAITQKYLTPDMRVVEFGCGTGSTAIVHAPEVKTYDAIDVSEKMVEIGRHEGRRGRNRHHHGERIRRHIEHRGRAAARHPRPMTLIAGRLPSLNGRAAFEDRPGHAISGRSPLSDAAGAYRPSAWSAINR
jgi:SAM-dependent methyltransferase